MSSALILMPAPVCARCKTKNSADSAFCRACGAALTASASPPGSEVRPQIAIRVVRADGGPEVVVPMGSDELTCGILGDIPLVDDPFVAPTQARFFLASGKLAVEDVGGGNGVFLRLRDERELITGGELRLGRQRLVLEPVPPLSPGPDGATSWGSPDIGHRFRLIQILEGGTRGAAFVLKDGENFVGRESGEINFPTDAFVSGRHAVLQVHQGRLWVRDVGSSNGTFLRLSAPTELGDGDHLLIGRELLRIEVGGQ